MGDKIFGGKEFKKLRGLGIGRIRYRNIEIINIFDSVVELVS